MVGKVRDGVYLLDLLASREFLNKCYVGLVAGNFLTIRIKSSESGRVGEVRDCPLCSVPATQAHFLNVCPSNAASREALSQSLAPGFATALLRTADYSAFYRNVRGLEVVVTGTVNEADPIPAEVYDSLASSASTLAKSFVENVLSLFEQDKERPL